MKTDINQRFIDAVEYIISEKIEQKKSIISKKLGISPSKFSEILKKRMSVGLETVAIFCDIYNISTDWLLMGKGTKTNSGSNNFLISDKKAFKENLNTNELQLLKKDLENAHATLEGQKDMIEVQKDLINNLKSDIQRLNTEIELLRQSNL